MGQSWQLGRVALAAGDSDGALASFCRAASSVAATADVAAARPVRVAGDLATQVGELRRQQESHREAQAALNRAEHEALNQLMAAIRAPAAAKRRGVRYGRVVPRARAAETSRSDPAGRAGAGHAGSDR